MSDQVSTDPRRRLAAAAAAAVAAPVPATEPEPTPEVISTPTEETSAPIAVEEEEQKPEVEVAPPSVEDASTTLEETSTTESTVPVESTTTTATEEEEQKQSELDAAIAATLAMEEDATDEPVAPEQDDSTSILIQPPSDMVIDPAASLPPSSNATPSPADFDTDPSASTTTTKPTTTGPKPSSLSRVAQLTLRVEKDPLDGEAQLALLSDAEQKGDLERTREVYEGFLKVFPDAARQWITYCDLELSHSLFDRVEAIFKRCLLSSTSIDLWKFYLDFVRRRNPVDYSQPEQGKAARQTITQSFEFALNRIGQDRRAGEVWIEYLGFLKEGGARGTWEEQQRMDALRKTYQRAVQVPLNNVEQIWQEYNQFENNLSKMTAKKFVGELSPAYMTARKALRELRAQFDSLYEPSLPSRPSWERNGSDHEKLEAWKKYLEWEEANPLDIEEPNLLQARVGFAWKKATASLRFFSEIWYLAAMYNLKLGKPDDARKLLQTGIEANPSSLLLSYTLAELEEARNEFETCYKIYDSLLTHFYSELSRLESSVQTEVTEALAAIDAVGGELSVPVVPTTNGEGEEVDESRQKIVMDKEEAKKNIEKKFEEEMELTKKAVANVWIAQMRFARRAEGIAQARKVFTKARKSAYLGWQVIEASATMEYFWNNDGKVATNVFELGLKTYAQEPEYVLQYLEHLIRTNNPNNARALFERTVALVEPAKAKPVWDRMAQYEYQYGDFLAAQKIFQRYTEAFPDSTPIDRFSQRYSYLNLTNAITRDLGVIPSTPSALSLDAEDDVLRSQCRSSRSPSPSAGGHKRPLPPHMDDGEGSTRASSVEPRGGGYADKKHKGFHPEGSPAPSSAGGAGGVGVVGGWGRADEAAEPPRARPLGNGGGGASFVASAAPGLNRPIPFMLDSRGDNVAILPDAVVFFLSILPSAASFNGPMLNPATIVDVIGTTLLPGSVPGPGLPGERLGVPPRPKPEARGGGAPAAGGGAPVSYGGPERRPLSPPRVGRGQDYGYGSRGSGGGGGGSRSRY